MDILIWLVPIAGVVGVAALFWLRPRPGHAGLCLDDARRNFELEWVSLHARFFEAASQSGKPRGLRWKDCQWSDLVAWVRDKQTGQLLALVGVTISFEAIEGGDMEGVEAVGNLRNASAVFFYDGVHWQTVGRAIFNLNPDEAVSHFQGGYERVDG